MKKRALALVLSIIMAFGLMTPVAFAADNSILSVTGMGTGNTLKTGDVITVTATVPVLTNITSGNVQINFNTSYLVAQSINGPTTFSGYGTTITDVSSANSAGSFSISIGNGASSSFDMTEALVFSAELKVKVDAPSGSISNLVSVDSENYYFYDADGSTERQPSFDKTAISATIVSAISGNLPITITAPVKGAVPQSTIAAGTGYTGSITWEGSPTTFAPNTAYTANVELTANTGYQFANSVNPTVAGATSVTAATVTDNGSKLTFKATFPATVGADALDGTVSIKGTAKFDETLTVDTTSLNYGSEAAGTLSYQWYRDDTAIVGATNSSYKLVAADVGKTIKVQVKNSNNSGSVMSAATATVAKKDYSGTVKTPVVYSTTDTQVTVNKETGYEYAVTPKSATAEPNSWSMSGIIGDLTPNTEYKLWGRVAATDTTNASAAVSTLFTTSKTPITSVTASVAAPAKGTALATTVDVDSTAAYAGTVVWYEGSTATGTVATGAAKANQVYTAKITLTAKAGESFADSITAPTGYTLGEHDTGKVVLTKTFDATASKNLLKGSVTIDKTSPKLGETLTATPTLDYNGETAGTLSYQWYRGDAAIDGATNSTYVLTAADVGKTIKVQVKNSNNSGSVMSAATATVAKKDYSGAAATAATVSKTANSVTVTNVTSGQEYAITTGSSAPTGGWNTTGTFTGLNANTHYKVYTRVAATDTTNASTAVSTDVTTDKAAGSIVIADPGTIIYDGNAVEVGSGKDLTYSYNGDGTIAVKWYADNNGTKADQLSGAPKNAGTYWIGVSAAEGTSSAAVAEVTKKFTISKAAVDGIPGFTAIDTSGKILEDVGLNFGTITIDGDLQWVPPLSDDTPVEQGESYRWCFIPKDDKNYATLEGTITPWPASGSGTITIIVPSTEEPAKPADQKNPSTGAVSDHIGYAVAGLAVVGVLCVGAKKLAKKDED